MTNIYNEILYKYVNLSRSMMKAILYYTQRSHQSSRSQSLQTAKILNSRSSTPSSVMTLYGLNDSLHRGQV